MRGMRAGRDAVHGLAPYPEAVSLCGAPRLALLIAALCGACGGRIASSGSSGPGTADPGGGAGATSIPVEAEAGTRACLGRTDDAGNGVCVFCSDHMWHCDGPDYAPCPAGVQNLGSCSAWAEPVNESETTVG
jgi:hypothetical protein